MSPPTSESPDTDVRPGAMRPSIPHGGRWEPLAGGMGYGLLTVLAFAPIGLWPVALVALVPVVWSAARMADRPGRVWKGAALVSLGVLPAWAFEERWLIDVTVAGYPGLAILLSFYTGLAAWLIASVRRAFPRIPLAVVVPIVWTGVEMLRGDVVATGYAWFLLSHPLIESSALSSPGATVGAYGVSFLLAMVVGGLFDAAGWSGPTRSRRLVGAVLSFTGVLAWGGLGLLAPSASPTDAARSVRIGIIQTNVPQSNKISWDWSRRVKDFNRFLELTREAAAPADGEGADVIIWPETMFPGDGLNDEAVAAVKRMQLVWPSDTPGQPEIPMWSFAEKLLSFQKDLGKPMLVGALAIIGLREESSEGRKVRLTYSARYNSAMVLADGGVRQPRYDKMLLTPFGEVIPYLWRWPEAQQAVLGLGAAGMRFDLKMGQRPVAVSVPLGGGRPDLRCATPICFEATKTGVCRDLVYGPGGGGLRGSGQGGAGPRGGGPGGRQADLLVNLSNDGWFGRWAGGREQHMQAARWRCVELGIPMVRAVNTGISASIDRRGRLLAQGPAGRNQSVDVDGVLTVEVAIPRADSWTVYGRVGNVAGWSALGCTLILGIAAVRRRPRASPASTKQSVERA